MSADWVRRNYGLSVIRGQRVLFRGEPGVVTSFRGPYVRIRLDGQKHPAPCHPTWEMRYLTCYREVVARSGDVEPCERPATGYAIDPDSQLPYPACRRHATRATPYDETRQEDG